MSNDTSTSTSERPRRRFRLTLDLEADSIRDLTDALEHIAWDIHAEGRDERSVTSGGWSTGYHFDLVCDPDMHGDRFRAENAEYVKRLHGMAPT